MKVLHVNTVFPFGSTGRIASDICELLASNGDYGLVAYGRGNEVPGHHRICHPSSFLLHALWTRLTDQHGLFSAGASRKLINLIEAEKPDIIHLHNIHGYYLDFRILFDFISSTHLPVVWTLHDCWTFTGHCSHFDFIKCERWKTQCFSCPQLSQYPSSWIADSSKSNYVIKRARFLSIENITIVTPSTWLANKVKDSFFSQRNVTTINNGINLGIFHPNYPNVKASFGLESKFVLLGVANVWTSRKGLSYLLDLIAGLPESFFLIIVGKHSKRPPRHPRVRYIPRTTSMEELASIYASADVFVNPTLEDTFPTTNLEALACGTPVITFDTGGSPESITSETGFVVPQGDTQQLKSAVHHISKVGKSQFTQQCFEHAKLNFNKNDKYLEYLNLYRKVCA